MIKKSDKSKTKFPLSKEDGQLEKLEENRINNNDIPDSFTKEELKYVKREYLDEFD